MADLTDKQILAIWSRVGGWQQTDAVLAFARALLASRWLPIEACPSDTVVLLYSPDRGITNEERIEARVFHDTRAGSRHSWATHFQYLPQPPEST